VANLTNSVYVNALQVAFIVAVYHSHKQAAEALLELFRAAREVPSAEFIAVDFTGGEVVEDKVLADTIARMRALFGVRVQLVDAGSHADHGKALAAGEGCYHENQSEHTMLWRTRRF
jgi:hypothetical protein